MDKRRKARVQGGWAAPAKPAGGKDKSKRSPILQSQGLGKIMGCPVPETSQFVYEQPPEGIRQKPEVQEILKQGTYDISKSPSGISRLRLFPEFIDPKECDWMNEQLTHELPWQQRSDVKNGQAYLQPRLTAWFGDHPYSYSGVTLQANSEWNPLLAMLRNQVEEATGHLFNSMLANLYCDGKDHVPWHSDDEPALHKNPTIASLSFGATRMFELRKKPPQEDNGDYTYMEHIRLPLVAGSLLVMEGATQADWQHRVPQEYHDRGRRINLTFRMIYPET